MGCFFTQIKPNLPINTPLLPPPRGSVSRIGGMSLQDLQREAETLWNKGFPEKAMTKLEDFGFIQSKAKVGVEGR